MQYVSLVHGVYTPVYGKHPLTVALSPPPHLYTVYATSVLLAGRAVERGARGFGGTYGAGLHGAGAAGEDGKEPSRRVPPAHGKSQIYQVPLWYDAI